LANGWTGGQYSLYRAVLALTLATHHGVVGWLLAVPLALGFRDRWAAGLWLGYLGLRLGVGEVAWADAALLALHLVTPPRPYGSWDARGRVDPAGGWILPQPVLVAARVGLVIALGRVAFFRLTYGRALVVPLSLLSFNPARIRGKRDAAPARLFYDGECGVCHAAVRFVLAEDRDGRGFRFAPLAGDSFAQLAPPELRASLPDSIVLALEDGTLLVRSAAVLEIGERLGGLWLLLARAARLVPERALDSVYDAFARNRKRFTRAPSDACPALTPELRARFD
jgi:predicted DCC family thiol-disulfide oxidoreductase YuxK